MKKPKSTKAKLRNTEKVIGTKVPESLMNQKRLKAISKSKKRK